MDGAAKLQLAGLPLGGLLDGLLFSASDSLETVLQLP